VPDIKSASVSSTLTYSHPTTVANISGVAGSTGGVPSSSYTLTGSYAGPGSDGVGVYVSIIRPFCKVFLWITNSTSLEDYMELLPGKQTSFLSPVRQTHARAGHLLPNSKGHNNHPRLVNSNSNDDTNRICKRHPRSTSKFQVDGAEDSGACRPFYGSCNNHRRCSIICIFFWSCRGDGILETWL
jgi:hypothetical protein